MRTKFIAFDCLDDNDIPVFLEFKTLKEAANHSNEVYKVKKPVDLSHLKQADIKKQIKKLETTLAELRKQIK